jgi:hypothetical protein
MPSDASKADLSRGTAARAFLVRFAAILAGVAVAVCVLILGARALAANHAGWTTVFILYLIFGAIVLGSVELGEFAAGRMTGATPSAPARRYRRRQSILIGVYVLTLASVTAVYHYVRPGSVLAWGLACAPTIPVLAVIANLADYMRKGCDELERAIMAEAALWATGGLLALATVSGFLETFGLIAHTPAWAAMVVWGMILMPAQFLVRRRYQ